MVMFPRHVTHPSIAELRRYGLTLAVALLGLTLVAVMRHGAETPWVGYLTPVAALVAVLGLLAPGALSVPYKAWCGAGYLVSVALSWVAVALMFWCVMVPLGLLFRCGGRDPLRLRRSAAGDGYWLPAAKAVGVRRYFRQF